MKFLRKQKENPINFGKVSPIAKLSIVNEATDEEIERAIYELPYRIGSALGNDLTIKESGLDRFHIFITLFNRNLYLINLSYRIPLYVEKVELEFANPYLVEKSLSISAGNLRIFLMPEIKNPRRKKAIKNFTLVCPLCTGKFTIEDKTCEICSFGGSSTSRIKLTRFKNILELTDFKDAYYEYPTIAAISGETNETYQPKTAFVSIPPAQLRVMNSVIKGEIFSVVDEETSIGRSKFNSLSLAEAQDSTMSRFHCKIIKKIEGYYIEDNGSLNGTNLNGKPVKYKKLDSGDIIKLGNTEILFSYKRA